MLERPNPGSIPDTPGTYIFKDSNERVLYVGKAASLRSRLASYFQNRDVMPARTAQMLELASNLEWIQVGNEVEALLLENELIKKHQPRFNVRLRDDKSYPWLAVTVGDEWPRAAVLRGKQRKGVRYFGPYGHAYAIRETLDLLLRTFPIRTCSDSKLGYHQRIGKPCLLFHIERCAAPCVGEVTREEYDRLVAELLKFLEGEVDEILAKLEQEMERAAAELEFERAARFRDRLTSVRRALEKQQIVLQKAGDLDVVGIADDPLQASVQVFYVRRGRVVGRRGFVLEKGEDLTSARMVARVIEGLYAEVGPNGVPKQVLVPDLPEESATYEEWLTGLRGSAVSIRVPRRGDKRKLLLTVRENAEEELSRHRLRRASDHNARARSLSDLQRHLELSVAPLRIECFDMSHLHGTDYVGSMVVFEDALAKKSEYRRFQVRSVAGNDDLAAMEEVLRRRLGAYLSERGKPIAEGSGHFSYPPQLILVDGGKGQLEVADRVVRELGLAEEIAVAALAKRLEEVFVPGRATPVDLPRQSEALYLLQRIRDEAHRFAVEYHRKVRGKRMRSSKLDGVRGLGPNRKARLIKELGGVTAVERASLEDLRSMSWLPRAVAERLHEHLHGPARPQEPPST